jgi:dTDP-4-dehydrorhamnose reductase
VPNTEVKTGPKTTLVVGVDGQIGKALWSRLAISGAAAWGTSRRPCSAAGVLPLDLADEPRSWHLPRDVETAYLCAAVASLAACRASPAESALVNVERTAALGQRLVEAGAFVVFLSTNLVFDGSLPFRSPRDDVSPATEYGRQKAEAERRLLALGNAVAVVRLTKVLGPATPFLAQWRADLARAEPIRPFSDVVMAPLPLGFVGESLARLAGARRPGLFQLSADRDVTYAQAARRMARRLGADPQLVRAIGCEESDVVLESNPRHTTLDTTRWQSELGAAPPSPWQSIDEAAGLRAPEVQRR